ncbi:MAG: molecular chaperone GrpE [Dokdonia sp.]|jgi:molecular chaperone GrpE
MAKKDNTQEIEDIHADGHQDGDIATDTENEATIEISEVDQLKSDLEAEKDKFLRLFAEFENYKRRTTKERIELFKTAGQEVIQSLLPVVDDFDRALAEIEKSKDKELAKGVGLISNKLKETLKSKGLEETKVKAGDAFDAELHEAITQIPAPSKKMVGKIVDVIEKGYSLGDKVIRFPKVVTGK